MHVYILIELSQQIAASNEGSDVQTITSKPKGCEFHKKSSEPRHKIVSLQPFEGKCIYSCAIFTLSGEMILRKQRHVLEAA